MILNFKNPGRLRKIYDKKITESLVLQPLNHLYPLLSTTTINKSASGNYLTFHYGY